MLQNNVINKIHFGVGYEVVYKYVVPNKVQTQVW